MRGIPVVQHFTPDPPLAMTAAAERYYEQLCRSHGELAVDDRWDPLRPASDEPPVILHVDDQSKMPVLERWRDIRYRQEAARLRAGDGGLIATTIPPVAGYVAYCREHLGLGAVQWLQPQPARPRHLAVSLWRDEQTRSRIVAAARAGGGLAIDPYKGTLDVWQLAALLSEQSGCPVTVWAPPPALAAWVNDKLHFAEMIENLFGKHVVPHTMRAASFAKAAEAVRQLADRADRIVLKLPDSAGGGGNVVTDAAPLRGRPLREVRARLRELFRDLDWDGSCELLVGHWETGVVSAPSVQVWIPPAEGPPVVEGLFEQSFGDERGIFAGSARAELPDAVAAEIVDRSWVIACLYQRLGYVGRCSFDLLLVENGTSSPRIEFLECNGRWGSTSVPMTLMNRLFGDWMTRPYACRDYVNLGMERVSLEGLLDAARPDLFDHRTGRGNLILVNPARMAARGGITAIALADDWSMAKARVEGEVPRRLAGIASHLPAAQATQALP